VLSWFMLLRLRPLLRSYTIAPVVSRTRTSPATRTYVQYSTCKNMSQDVPATEKVVAEPVPQTLNEGPAAVEGADGAAAPTKSSGKHNNRYEAGFS
jgi:hypothetical protein